MQNHYKNLGISQESSLNEIKSAYRNLAKKYHPDSSNSDVKKFLEIKKSYEFLIENSNDKKEKAKFVNANIKKKKNSIFSKFSNKLKFKSSKKYQNVSINIKEAIFGTNLKINSDTKTSNFKLRAGCFNGQRVTFNHENKEIELSVRIKRNPYIYFDHQGLLIDLFVSSFELGSEVHIRLNSSNYKIFIPIDCEAGQIINFNKKVFENISDIKFKIIISKDAVEKRNKIFKFLIKK